MRAILLPLLLTTGCLKKPGNVNLAASEGGAAASYLEKADALWTERGDKAKLAEALKSYEQAYLVDTKNKRTLARLVRGWYFMGDAHETEKANKMKAWDTAFSFGEKCLALNEDYKAILEKSGSKSEAVSKAQKEDVPCIYWSASSLGKWAKLNGIIQSIKHKETLKNFISKVEELQPDYFHGAANRYWGAYYSVIPKFAGRDLDKSKENFDKSLKIAPHYLGTYLLMAGNWAKNSQDVESFDQAVQYVMASDPEALPAELLPENRNEIKRAKEIWAERNDMFRDPGEISKLKTQPPKKPAPAPEPAPETTPESTPEAAPTNPENK